MSEFGWRILLVEDDEFDRELMFRALKNYGNLKVQLARDGEEATKIIGEGDEPKVRDWSGLPQLIFLDLKLPDGPADDVYDMAKEQQPECPIIIITGYPDSEMLNRILAKGPITVLKKPLKVEQLKDTVRILGHKDAVKLAA